MEKDAPIYVAGHRGMVGSACERELRRQGYGNLILRTRRELDLTDAAATRAFFQETRPRYVIDAAARVGGILANKTFPVDFLETNVLIQVNLMRGAFEAGVEKFLFLGSSCIYPKEAVQPMREDALLAGPLEPTNQAYAIAKISGILLAEAYRSQHGASFISAMPTNLYGPGDNFDLQSSHVLPALIRKFHEAKERGDEAVTCWGSGRPRREFLFVDDLAEACVFLLENYDAPGHVNVGFGEDLTIADLAETVRRVVGFEGRIDWDASMPDGTMRKLMDISKIRELGWTPKTSLENGIRLAYDWYLQVAETPAPSSQPT
ncbi:MAG: GDP-L-fucose synthase [Verrucomicrobiota bacterium]